MTRRATVHPNSRNADISIDATSGPPTATLACLMCGGDSAYFGPSFIPGVQQVIICACPAGTEVAMQTMRRFEV